MAEVKCPDCGDPFDPEFDGTWVRTSRRAGKDVCLNCREEYRFDCGVCGEWCDKDPEANSVGSDVFVMIRPCDAFCRGKLEPGLYRILMGPFMGGPLIGEPYFLPDRVQRVGPLPASTCIQDSSACAPVCQGCQRRLLGCVRHWQRRKRTQIAAAEASGR